MYIWCVGKFSKIEKIFLFTIFLIYKTIQHEILLVILGINMVAGGWKFWNIEKITEKYFWWILRILPHIKYMHIDALKIWTRSGKFKGMQKNAQKLHLKICCWTFFWRIPVLNGKIESDFRILDHLWEVVSPLIGGVGW